MGRNFLESDQLAILDPAIPADAVILDVGAMQRHSRKVHAFAPVDETFKILSRKIEMNRREEKVTLLQLALGGVAQNLPSTSRP
jgi:hypothetical protein